MGCSPTYATNWVRAPPAGRGLLCNTHLPPYRLQSYGAGAPYGSEGGVLPANAGFAPLALRNGLYNSNNYNGYSNGLGTVSVGVPVRIGSGSAVLSVGGSVGSSFLR